MIQSCKHSSVMLLNLINDLLDLAKTEKKTFQLNKSFFNLNHTVKNTFTILDFLASQKKVKLSIQISPNQEKLFENIYGDQGRYEQILINFISNAIKFTNHGSEVRVAIEAVNVYNPTEMNEDDWPSEVQKN